MPDVDITLDILNAVVKAQPLSSFAASLLQQYRERGGLSKKQLEGLYNKALKVEDIPPNKLVTLEAIIKKKHTKHKSELPVHTALYTKDEEAGQLIESILAKFPEHKRVLFLKARYDNNDTISPQEKDELLKFSKLAEKR